MIIGILIGSMMATYKKSRRPIKKTNSMEMIEEYKSKNLKNVLMTGLNNRLLANLQQKITESKSAASLSGRLQYSTVEE